MEKRGLLLLSYIAISILLIKFSIAASIFPTSNSGNLIADTLKPLGIANPGEIYSLYGQFIDFILFLIIFISISKKFLGPRIDSKAASAVGILIAFGAAFFEYTRGFKLGDLGILWGVVILIIIGALAFNAFKGTSKVSGFMIAYILIWLFATFMLTETDKETLGILWGWFQFIGVILFFIGIIMMFTWIFRFGRSSFPRLGEIGNIAKGGLRAADETRQWYSGIRDTRKLRQGTERLNRLQTLITSIENEQRKLTVDILKNEQKRNGLLTNMEGYIRILIQINQKLPSNDPKVIAERQTLQQQYREAIRRLTILIESYYNLLRQALTLIDKDRRAEEQDNRLLKIETNEQINAHKKIFREIYDIIKYAKDPRLNIIETQIENLRTIMSRTLNDIRKLVNPKRMEIYNTLRQLNYQDINLTSNLYNAVTSQNFGQALTIIRSLRQNLGREISITSSDNLKNKDISALRDQLTNQNTALKKLYNEIEFVFNRMMGPNPP